MTLVYKMLWMLYKRTQSQGIEPATLTSRGRDCAHVSSIIKEILICRLPQPIHFYETLFHRLRGRGREEFSFRSFLVPTFSLVCDSANNRTDEMTGGFLALCGNETPRPLT